MTETLYESEGATLFRALGRGRVLLILEVLDPRRAPPKALDRHRSEFESEPEAGSTFTVELPCDGPPHAREQDLRREPS